MNTKKKLIEIIQLQDTITHNNEAGYIETLKPLQKKRDALMREIAKETEALRKALKEIAKREGPFSIGRLTHASNVIENMASIAEEALKETE